MELSEKRRHLRIILNDQICQQFSDADIDSVFDEIDPDYAQVLIAGVLLSGDEIRDLVGNIIKRIMSGYEESKK